MQIYFVETESQEREFFAENLPEAMFTDELGEVPEDAEVLSTFIYSQVDAGFLDAHPRLRLVTTRSTGMDHIDLAECARRGVTVCHVPSYGNHTVAEHTFALILSLSRRLPTVIATTRQKPVSFEAIRAFDLFGKTLGVVGTGRIGRMVIQIAKAFGMKVLAREVEEQPAVAAELGFRYVSLDELLRESHVITLHMPLTDETHHLFNREAFAKCRRGVLIVNTSRGAVIDTAAFNEALDSGIVGGAGLDVLEDERILQQEHSAIIGEQIYNNLQSRSPHEAHRRNPERVQELQALMQNSRLLARPNVVFTPHAAFNSQEAVDRINRTTLENIARFAEGSPMNLAPAGSG